MGEKTKTVETDHTKENAARNRIRAVELATAISKILMGFVTKIEAKEDPLFQQLLKELAAEADKGHVHILEQKLKALEETLKQESGAMEQEITSKIVTGGRVCGGSTEE